MKRQWLITGILILSMAAFTACGKKAQEGADQSAQTENAQEEGGSDSAAADTAAASREEEALEDFVGGLDLTGIWEDEVSQRAAMDVEKNDDGSYHILIQWGMGADETAFWEINGIYDETAGMLSYKEADYSLHAWDDKGSETISGETKTEGALMKEGDKLRWQDSKISEDGLFVRISG